MEILKKIGESLQEGEPEQVLALTKEAIAARIPPEKILNEGLLDGMNVVGQKFKIHEIFLPDVLMAARAMYAGLDELKPLLLAANVPSLGRIAIGSVEGDLHDIGKNLVGIMLKGAGFDVIDLGHDVPPEKFAAAVEEDGAVVIGMSALLTTTMANMKKTVDFLKERGLTDKARIIVGGAPVSEEYAKEIGADAYAYDAASAVEGVKLLIETGGS